MKTDATLYTEGRCNRACHYLACKLLSASSTLLHFCPNPVWGLNRTARLDCPSEIRSGLDLKNPGPAHLYLCMKCTISEISYVSKPFILKKRYLKNVIFAFISKQILWASWGVYVVCLEMKQCCL